MRGLRGDESIIRHAILRHGFPGTAGFPQRASAMPWRRPNAGDLRRAEFGHGASALRRLAAIRLGETDGRPGNYFFRQSTAGPSSTAAQNRADRAAMEKADRWLPNRDARRERYDHHAHGDLPCPKFISTRPEPRIDRVLTCEAVAPLATPYARPSVRTRSILWAPNHSEGWDRTASTSPPPASHLEHSSILTEAHRPVFHDFRFSYLASCRSSFPVLSLPEVLLTAQASTVPSAKAPPSDRAEPPSGWHYTCCV